MLEIKKGTNNFYLGQNEHDFLAEITYYVDGNNHLVVDHTFVDPSLRGQGIANQLVLKVIEYAQSQNLKIVPECSYVISFFQKNHEYHDVLVYK